MGKLWPFGWPFSRKTTPDPASMAAHRAAESGLANFGWNPVAGSADSDLLDELEPIVARSRDLARNNGLMAGGMQTLRDNIVGAVLKLSSTPDYRLLGWTREQAREWGNDVEAHFRSWADSTECDAGRSLNFLGLAIRGLSDAMLNGDAVALPIWKTRPGEKWATRIKLIESDRLATPATLSHHPRLRGGIEFDIDGAPIAYHIASQHPGERFSTLGLLAEPEKWERIPAYTDWGRRQVIHLHDKERTGQSRGKPIVSAVMQEFRMAGEYASNELKASVANSLVAAFLESDLGPEGAAQLFGEDPRAAWQTSVSQARRLRKLEGAAVISLPAGAKLSSFAPGRPNAAFESFMLASLRHIAAGMNMPYELLVKDFSRANYSSIRAAMLEAWRFFLGRRRWLADHWLRPIYELWLEEAVNTGVISAPDYYANRYAYTRCRFIFGGRGWVDPVKEAQASVLRMAANLSTMEIECAEQGFDYEEILDQQAIERDMRAARGLTATAPETTKRTGISRRDTDSAREAGQDEDAQDDGDDTSDDTAYHNTLAMLTGEGVPE